MNNNLKINGTFTNAQVKEFNANFEVNGKDSEFVNPENPVLYIAAILEYVFSNAAITYIPSSDSFSVFYVAGNGNYSIEYTTDELTKVFNMLSTTLLKTLGSKGNKFTADFLSSLTE